VSTTQKTKHDFLPLDPKTQMPIEPVSQPGYYPGFSTLSQQKFWDEATRKVVLERVEKVPHFQFFGASEARLLTAICDRMLPQDDRDEEHRIPIAPFIDKRLHEGRIDGYRYEDMPPDREAYHLGLEGIEEIAKHLYDATFTDLTPADQERVLKTVHDGKPPAGHAIWARMSVHRFWMLLLQDCLEVYYAHPWVWDEIGYGGPAYPRAYMRLEHGQPEPWEVNEQRYDWESPPGTVSDRYEFIAGQGEHRGSPGQGGTH
jgi:hypothetical protein